MPNDQKEIKQRCKVNGLKQKGMMCGWIIVGGKFCGFKGECDHKDVSNDK